MTPRVLKALKASIAHWERLALGLPSEPEPGAESCPLCGLFNRKNQAEGEACKGCPVYKKTHKQFCENTPYTQVQSEWDGVESFMDPRTSYGVRKAALKEMRFLESLLPRTVR